MAAMGCGGGGVLHLWSSSSVGNSRQSHELVTEPCKVSITGDTTAVDNRKACNFLCVLACPICHQPLKSKNESRLTSLECESCKKTYSSNESYYDLTITSSSTDFAKPKRRSTEFFRSPLVSCIYERGWRQSFLWAGYPGAVKEFKMAKEYLRPTFGGTIIDASCGSGLFSRMFSKSGLYKCVIALDFSENMLKQCSEYAKREGISRENLVILRADIASLPFESSSVGAVHAGAALNCWPSPSAALAEIIRVLRPGGLFVATTNIADRGLFSMFPLSRQLNFHLSLSDLCQSYRSVYS